MQVLMIVQRVLFPAEHLLSPPQLFKLFLNGSYGEIL